MKVEGKYSNYSYKARLSLRNWLVYIMLPMLIFPWLASTLRAAPSYYYHQGMKVSLVEDKRHICIVAEEKNIPENYPESLGLSNPRIIGDADYDVSVYDILPRPNDDDGGRALIKSSIKGPGLIALPCYLNVDGETLYGSPYLYIKLKNAGDSSILKEVARGECLRIARHSILRPLWYTLAVTAATRLSPLELSTSLYETGMFAIVEPDFVTPDMALFTYDTNVGQQWSLHNRQHPGIDINISEAWNYATGWNVKIAFVDQGMFRNNADIGPNLDSLSYDTEESVSPAQYLGAHGTCCAGVAAAVRNNNRYIAGVAPDASIISISHSLQSVTSVEKFAEGISWAWKHEADIISCSWKINNYSSLIEEALDSALTYGRNGLGCVVVFASGNDTLTHHMYAPELDNRVITVGAISANGQRWSASRWGPRLDVMAPGEDVLTTHPLYGTKDESGTSLACPHVSGLAALILERNPGLTASQVKNIIEKNTRKVGHLPYQSAPARPNGTWNQEYGYGLIDATRAIKATPRADW